MSVLSALGRGIGALGRGAAYLRRQRFGYTPEVEAAMRDNYLAALQADEEERAWKREEVEGRRQDRQLRRDELKRAEEERKAREKLAATARALELLPGLVNADVGPQQPLDLGQLSRLTGADEDTLKDALAATERRLAGERMTEAQKKKAKAEEEAARDRREWEQSLKMIGAQQDAALEGYKRREEWDEGRPKPTKAPPQLTFEDALRLAPAVNPETGLPMSTDERVAEANRLLGYSRAAAHPEDADLFLPEPRVAAPAGGSGPPPDWTGHGVTFNGAPVPFSKLPAQAQAKAASKWTGR